ncbi:glucose 1-dehydrogenase [Brevibacillus humidisoli]|uniref:SDR family NAD(P)-dependent oxidoreductase n=1 Tax=Brevibacillus humidisoli TaxID=2895522 RepID=UPI001E2859B8|nr:glucose 1-dehydrogenase [Brevibacillus humidisoli]UFJ41227.1 glucose 1-dehydrogenase [Brevibacillus humidisoli]
MEYRNKVVVVTGAGRGIGRAIALAYGGRGAQIVIADRDEEESQLTKQAVEDAGGSGWVARTDVSQPEQIVSLMQNVVERYGKIDILINNAGVSEWKDPYELSVADWDRILNTNLRSVFFCSREAARWMKQRGGGAIVNIASTRALMSEPHSEAYAASKGGIVALTHALAVSLGPDGVRVNAISPGWIETGDYQQLRPLDHAQHPVGRVGNPEDIAKACLFLTGSDSDFITGTNLVIDGGMTKKMIYEP